MFTLIVAEIIQGFKRIWKLYLTNVISIMLIILLFAYIDGSRRQLNLQNTVFSGEIVLKMKENIDNIPSTLMKKIPQLLYITQKVRSDVQYRLPGRNNSGSAELIGVNLQDDKNLAGYLTLLDGKLLQEGKDILVPSSLLQKTDIKVGDTIRITGKTSDKVYNAAGYKICGIYNSPGLNLFSTPRFLVKYSSMEAYFMPQIKDIEFCLFFKGGIIPDTINKDIREALDDQSRTKIDSIEAMRVSSWDVLNISVQFNVFLILMIILTIIVVVTVVLLVNFNIYMILFRKRQKEIGTLMSFGIPSWKIGLTLLLESVSQLVISTFIAVVLCYLTALIAKQQIAGGFLEVLFVLLSGTNRMDLYIQFYQIKNAFLIILSAVIISQIPLFFKVLISNPINVMQGK